MYLGTAVQLHFFVGSPYRGTVHLATGNLLYLGRILPGFLTLEFTKKRPLARNDAVLPVLELIVATS